MEYIKVSWPESQKLIDAYGFHDNCELAREAGTYFVNKEWYDKFYKKP